MKKIEPKILKGTRDFMPKEMAKRNMVMAKIRNIFERFGYSAIETPIINPADTILGKYGEEGDRLTYNFDDNGGRRIAIPYDLTVPFARFVAANWQDLPMPFKRYQIQRVWRAEKPQKGRLREFYQCDVDIIGTRSLIAEGEIAKIIVTVFEELGFKNFVLKVNSRRLINAIFDSFGIDKEKFVPAIRVIDKLDKIGQEKVVAMLDELGIDNAKELMAMLTASAKTKETLQKLEGFDLSEMKEFLEICEKLGVDLDRIQFDPCLARGLDYYTGMIYEVLDLDTDFGSIAGGGRYDNLCSTFCKEDFSGVGIAFGFDRILLAMEEKAAFADIKPASKALIAIFDEQGLGNALEIYKQLLEAKISCEIYFEPAKLAKQFKFADKKEIPFVIIQGPEEAEKDQVMVKNMETGQQDSVSKSQLSSYLQDKE